jgi:YD repeat-containing protein
MVNGHLITRRRIVAALAGVLTQAVPGVRRAAAQPRNERGARPPGGDPVLTAPVEPETTTPGQGGALLVRVAIPAAIPQRALAAMRPDRSPAGRRLARLVARGAAAGLLGDVYDNRDRGHSRMRPDHHPALTFSVYGAAARRERLDYGLPDRFVFDAPTLGNSSTAVTSGPLRRSLPRLAMTRRDGMAALRRLYHANAIYVFPEHRDHDPERGDLFPANTPYCLITQGSSGSDQPMLKALAQALAALPPDSKAHLRARGLIAPALQILLRQALAEIRGIPYLDGAAHPTAFDMKSVATEPLAERLIDLAQAMRPTDVPALTQIVVESETAVGPPPEPFASLAAERLLDTPEAVARIAIGPAVLRRYRLRAVLNESDGRPGRIVWRVLRGAGVRLTPLATDGAAVEITAPWQEPTPVPGGGRLTSTRIDVAAFAETVAGLGPPSFFSVFFPRDRVVKTGPDGRLLSIDHRRPKDGPYVDPALFPHRDWRDTLQYDTQGRLLGWTRLRDGVETEHDRLGGQILSRDEQGRARLSRVIEYGLAPSRKGDRGRRVTQDAGSRIVNWTYADINDRLGVAVPQDPPP